MADISNERDKILSGSAVRLFFTRTTPIRSRHVEVNVSTQVFLVDSAGVAYPRAINLGATRQGMRNLPTWTVESGTATLATSSGGATLKYSDMTSNKVTIRARSVEHGDQVVDPNVRPVGQESTPWKLVFNDEFAGENVNSTKWNVRYDAQNSMSLYDADPTQTVQNYDIKSGFLRIWPTAEYESRGFTTHGKFARAPNNGKPIWVEWRAKLPVGKGVITELFLTHHDHLTQRPVIAPLVVFNNYTDGTTTVEQAAPAEANSIGVEYHGDGQIRDDSAEGVAAAVPQYAEMDAKIDAAYAVSFKGSTWNSANKLRNGIDQTAFATQMGSSSARVVILQVGWVDYYENRTVAQMKADLSAMVDAARAAATAKFVIIETPHETDDSGWHAHLTGIREVASEKGCPLIDQFQYSQDYRVAAGVGIYTLVPNGWAPNADHHLRLGQNAAKRFMEIANSASGFPKPTETTTTETTHGALSGYRPLRHEFDIWHATTTTAVGFFDRASQDVDLSASHNYFAVYYDSAGVQFFRNGQPLAAKRAWLSGMDTTLALYIVSRLHYVASGSGVPNTTDTPVGNTNALEIDYVRAWELDTTIAAPTPTEGTSSATDVRPVGHANTTWPLVFRDEFNDPTFTANNWNDEIWYGDNDGFTHTQVNYDVNNLGNSLLRIWPYYDPTCPVYNGFPRRLFDTDGIHQWQYGYFECSFKACRGKGTWPGFWLFAHPGDERWEIDIAEIWTGDPDGAWGTSDHRPNNYAATDHDTWADGLGDWSIKLSDVLGLRLLDDAQHIYGLAWYPDRLEFYFDGILLGTRHGNECHLPMYALIQLWYGGAGGLPTTDLTPTGVTNAMEIDYFRVWSFDGTSNTAPTSSTDSTGDSTVTYKSGAAAAPSGSQGTLTDLIALHDQVTIIKAVEGSSTINTFLTNEHHILSCDKDGNADTYEDCATHVVVYKGAEDITNSCRFGATASAGVLYDQRNNTFQIFDLSADSGYLDITAYYPNNEMPPETYRMSIVKSKRT